MSAKVLLGVLAAAVAFLLATNPLVAQAAGFISSADIINNTIKSKDVKNNALKGKDVKDNKLTGDDINESTLGTVPNSTNLNGQAPSTYLDRVAFTSGGSGVIPGGMENSLLGPLSLTVPAGVHFVEIHGGASFDTPNMGFGIYYAVDGNCTASGTPFDQAQYEETNASGFTQGSASIHVAVPVTPGVHTFRLCSNNTAGNVVASTLLVSTVPTGSTGGATPKPDQGEAAPSRPGVAPR